MILLLVVTTRDLPPLGAPQTAAAVDGSARFKRRACGYQPGDAGVITRHMHPKTKES